MTFLTLALIFLGAALVVVPLFKRLGLSSVLGYLGAGVIIGPSGLGAFTEADNLLHFAEIGVVLLLFIIGLELQPRRLWVMRMNVFGLGSLQMTITTLVIAAIMHWGFDFAWSGALLLGFAFALSSTAFVLQLLGEQRQLNHAHGRAAFGVLLFQDIAVIPALVVLSLLAPSGGGHGGGLDPWLLLAAGAGLVAARYTLRPLLGFIARTGIHELFTAAALVIVVGAALGMQAVGLSMGLGAFIAGMMVADSEYRHQLETDVMPFKGLLLGLFFMAVGMSTNLALLATAPLLVLALAALLITLKAALLLPLASLIGLAKQDAARTAGILSQGGEFAFVLLTAGAGAGLIAAEHLELGVLVVTLSMISTPFLMNGIERLLGTSRAEERAFDEIDEAESAVIIAGFGRVGQIIGRVLTMRHIPFTALEGNPNQVDFVRQFGNKAYYGDVARLDVLQAAGLSEARALVLALDDVEQSLKVAEVVRETFPGVTIFARAQSRHHELMLREIGVQHVIRETLMSSLALTETVLQALGDDEALAKASVARFYEHDQRTLAKQASVFHDAPAFRQTTRDAAEELKQLFADDAADDLELHSSR